MVRVLTSQWGFTRPSSIYISLGIVRDIVPLFIQASRNQKTKMLHWSEKFLSWPCLLFHSDPVHLRPSPPKLGRQQSEAKRRRDRRKAEEEARSEKEDPSEEGMEMDEREENRMNRRHRMNSGGGSSSGRSGRSGNSLKRRRLEKEKEEVIFGNFHYHFIIVLNLVHLRVKFV